MLQNVEYQVAEEKTAVIRLLKNNPLTTRKWKKAAPIARTVCSYSFEMGEAIAFLEENFRQLYIAQGG